LIWHAIKELTKKMLDMASIPVAKEVFVDEEDLAETINKIGYPIVLKPLDGNHGKGLLLMSLIGKMLLVWLRQRIQ
jgi:glutathione synthase/RimK-type ligase-like ATP-grasp enzyme